MSTERTRKNKGQQERCAKPRCRGIIFLLLIVAAGISWQTNIPEGLAATRLGLEKTYFERRAGKIALNSQITVTSGDYGLDKDTTLVRFSETGKYITDTGEIGLTIPYLIRNGGGVVAEETSAIGTQTIPRHASGIGDLLLKGKYYWLEEKDHMPGVDLMGKIKFPTASHDRGLGTGKFDFGFGPSLIKRFGQVITLLDAELIVRQRPNGSTLRPLRGDYSLGVGYLFSEKITGYFFLEGSTKPSRSGQVPLELVFAGNYKHTQTLRCNTAVTAGLTDGSPNIGVSMGVTNYF